MSPLTTTCIIKATKVRLAIILFLTLVDPAVASPSKAEPSIEFSFDVVEMEKPDIRQKADHLRSAINLKCELVEFDFSQLIELIDAINDQGLTVDETDVSVRFFDGYWLRFVGVSSEVSESRPNGWPRVWEGTADDGNSSAMIVIQSETIARAHVSRIDVTYVLYPSNWSEHSFLCMRDPKYKGKKID